MPELQILFTGPFYPEYQ